MHSLVEADAGDSGLDSFITQAEVTEVVKKLHLLQGWMRFALSTSSLWMLCGCHGRHASSTLHGGRRSEIRRETRGCVPFTGGSHTSASLVRPVSGYWRGKFSR
ncbi:hypothetical protein AMECASPLE_028727 [Ameca splendens]|uniref:Uncharacterized protein n=1 Tax=Ameca splendens TaxID=208324 RepID=A0ABV0YH95_9TELE